MRRVVVTGVGPITPIGVGAQEFEAGWVRNVLGINDITYFDSESHATRMAGQVELEHGIWIPDRVARRVDRFALLGMIASDLAFQDAQISTRHLKSPTGTFVGTGCGGADNWLEAGLAVANGRGDRMGPRTVPNSMANSAASMISIRHDLLGPSLAPVSACSAGLDAIVVATQSIMVGEVDVAIAGGTEAPISPIVVGGFGAMKAMSRSNEDPGTACKPFSDDRDGFVISEGAGLVVLEDLEHALARDADIKAEIIGFGRSSDAHHITQPSPEGLGAQRAMSGAIARAGLSPTDVHFISAHGTGTELNDRSETAAIKAVFGDAAYSIPTSSLKGNIGHSLGAAGATSAIASVQALVSGIVPGTANLVKPDPELDLNYMAGGSEKRNPQNVMVNTNAFGGENVSVILGKWN